ncbi:MAG: biopolymer transporter ExbD [Chromatiales bacterium]|nr:biopolymer transporter ExbD [Chromatiales bacterium]
MARRHHYKDRSKQVELDITTFLNLMVVLIPFLLVTAVFSRITIQELNLPSQAAGGEKPDKPVITIEVIIRTDKVQLSDGKKVIATFAGKETEKEMEKGVMEKVMEYDIKGLSKHLLEIKGKHEEKLDATILVEPDIEYAQVIRVMDAVKVAEVKQPDSEEVSKVVLFPQLSLGDAP